MYSKSPSDKGLVVHAVLQAVSKLLELGDLEVGLVLGYCVGEDQRGESRSVGFPRLGYKISILPLAPWGVALAGLGMRCFWSVVGRSRRSRSEARTISLLEPAFAPGVAGTVTV